MFNWLRKKVVGLTDEELVAEGKCPDCKTGTLLEGPSGGAAMNVLCENCMHEFNIFNMMGIIKIDARRGLTPKSRARFFGVTEEEYDAKVSKQEKVYVGDTAET